MAATTHKRGFVSIASGQIHYRTAGAGAATPAVLLHAAPAASMTLVPLLEALGATRQAYAPDCPGMGDSAPLPHAGLDLPMLAAASWESVDALGLGEIDLYGNLTGARIAAEMALQAPARVRHLALDGISLMDEAEQADYIANYAPDIATELNGAQFNAVWNFCRDQYLFFPWYKTDAAHRRSVGLPPAHVLHAKAMDVLKALDSFPTVLRASLRYPVRERLALLAVPTLAEKSLAAFIPHLTIMQTPMVEPLTAEPEILAAKAAEIMGFFDRTDVAGHQQPNGSAS